MGRTDRPNLALITGINGQDGSYLAEFLLEKGYEVHGIVRRGSVKENETSRITHLLDRVTLHYADLTDLASLTNIMRKLGPTEIYNLAAMSDVRVSFEQPQQTLAATGGGVLNVLEAVKVFGLSAYTRIYQASSSEMFGNNIDKDGFQRETTPMT